MPPWDGAGNSKPPTPLQVQYMDDSGDDSGDVVPIYTQTEAGPPLSIEIAQNLDSRCILLGVPPKPRLASSIQRLQARCIWYHIYAIG